MSQTVFVLLCVIVIAYIIIQFKIRSYANKQLSEYENIDTTVASYKPIVKPGDYKLIVTNIGAQKDTANKIISRYEGIKVEKQAEHTTVLQNVWVYTAEDCLAELEEVGVTAYITK